MNNLKQLLLGLACSGALPLVAQWELFPLGQRSYYQDMSLPGMQVDMVLMDSVWEDPQGGRYLFNKRSFRHAQAGNCAAYGLEHMATYYPMEGSWDMTLVMDSVFERGDTLYFRSGYSTTPFYFLPNAAVGQSWIISSTYSGNAFSDIQVSCTGISEETFVGVSDSVKTYSLEAVGTNDPIDDLQFRLSKTHGLVEYVPFIHFLIHPPSWEPRSFRLIGMESDGISHGYKQPGFTEYFHLSAGDVLLWENYIDPGYIVQGPPYYEYIRDSITNALITADSVVYTCYRVHTHADQSITLHPGVTRRYYKFNCDGFFKAAPNDIAKGGLLDTPYQYIWGSSPFGMAISPDGLDTLTTCNFSSEEFFLDNECMLAGPPDLRHGLRFNTREGLVGTSEWSNPSTYSSNVIASRIGGVEYGDISFGTGIAEPAEPEIAIHPNPASDRLFLTNTGLGGSRYNILDAFGRVVQRGKLAQDGVVVQDLPRGIYVLQVQGTGAGMSARFVKE